MSAIAGFQPIAVSDAKVIATLREVVAEQPGKVYEAPGHMREALGNEVEGDPCYYVHTDEDGAIVAPGCLIGAVLHRCGVPLSVLAEHEFFGAGVVLPLVIAGHRAGTEYDPLGDVLSTVQAAQDSGKSWGEALAEVTDRALI